jgi:hypothetical protein
MNGPMTTMQSISTNVRRGLCLLSLVAWLPAHSADTLAKSTPAACQFEPLKAWSDYAVQWSGPCAAGKASGLGVLRAYAKDKPTQVFYGRLTAGHPTLGVLDHPNGFMAGEVASGAIQPTDDRQLTINAFRVAEQAARQAAARFNAAGNKSSAQFYAHKAEQLGDQLD